MFGCEPGDSIITMHKQNNYKQNLAEKRMAKRGQTALFIIIALIIVVVIILVFLFRPQINSIIRGEVAPSSFISSCVDSELRNGVELLSKQGGYSDPEGYRLYNGEKVKYLCYTSQYYLPCYVQQPFIKRHVELELKEMIQQKTDECVQQLKSEYEKRGYSVTGVSEAEVDVQIIPKKIMVIVNAPMTVSKETTQTFDKFQIEVPSQLYNLLAIATSITSYEAVYGNTETLIFIRYYPNLGIDKTKLEDGTTIYTVSDAVTKEKFTFASRSLAWPAGYGLTT
jgi:hypothetical protein